MTDTTTQPKEWYEGYEAFWAGKDAAANPHPVPGRRAADWNRGWLDARDEWRKTGPGEGEGG